MHSKTTLGVITLALTGSAVFAQDVKQSLDAAIADVESSVIEWRRDIHRHPELSNREFRTASKVAAHLEALGIDDIRTLRDYRGRK